MTAMIALNRLTKSFPGPDGALAPVLRDVSLTIARGETFGVIGRSGAGKSTLIRCVNLLERPDLGQVWVDDQDLTALTPTALRAARRKIGMVFQHFNLLSSRSAAANIALPLELIGTPKAEIAARVDELLALVGLTERRDAYPAELSGGQKQRVGIARALASRPAVLLCDEATSALDPETTQSILALLKDINRRLGLTILLITHEMAVIRDVADRVAVLDGGAVVEQGTVFDVFTQPQHEVTRAFVAETLKRDLPAALAQRLAAGTPDGPTAVVRLTFTGPAAHDPIVTELVRRFGLTVNLLHGHIDTIQGAPFGVLTVSFDGPAAAQTAALDYIHSQNLKAEVLGRVGATDRAVA